MTNYFILTVFYDFYFTSDVVSLHSCINVSRPGTWDNRAGPVLDLIYCIKRRTEPVQVQGRGLASSGSGGPAVCCCICSVTKTDDDTHSKNTPSTKDPHFLIEWKATFANKQIQIMQYASVCLQYQTSIKICISKNKTTQNVFYILYVLLAFCCICQRFPSIGFNDRAPK